jgi:prevent-host-death family protein
MTERLAHRDLRNRSSEVLREVAAGATYEITNHGKVVAVLSPPRSRSELRVRPARVRGSFASLPRVSRDESVQDALDDLRGDR